jgi:hypothetical protein
VLLVIDLVDRHDQRLVDLPQLARELEIDRAEPLLSVHDEDQQIRSRQRDIHLRADLFGEAHIDIAADAAGIHDVKGSVPSLHFAAMRSRVTPGMSCTMETLRPIRRLKSADFPDIRGVRRWLQCVQAFGLCRHTLL